MSSSDEQKTNWFHRAVAALTGCREWIMERISGVLKSFFEVFATIFFTFVPFFFLSIKWLETEGSNTSQSLSHTFSGYWQAGEIVLPILGMCGAVTALLALNTGYFAWWVHAFVGAIILFFTIGGGAALIGTDGFGDPLNSELIAFGFTGYAILAFLWFLLAAKVRTTEPTTRKSNAPIILDQAKARRINTGSPS